jgi:hypothetical protein
MASAFSSNMRGTRGADEVTHSAVAVLQGSDGAYYLTTLRDPRGGATTLDPWHVGSFFHGVSTVSTSVRALDPSLKALVGDDEWINFSGEQIVPQLAD